MTDNGLPHTNGTVKTCTKCGVDYPLDFYYKKSKSKDGLNPSCKSCDSAVAARAYIKRCEDFIGPMKPRSKAETKGRTKHYDRSKYKDAVNDWRKRNPDKVKAQAAKYHKDNKEKCNESFRRWYQNNKEKHVHSAAMAMAGKRNATPKWLTDDHKKEISEIYKYRKAISDETGVIHHVDHIMPLAGDGLCGLHVPWNLRVIPAFDNISKKNRYDHYDMACLQGGVFLGYYGV